MIPIEDWNKCIDCPHCSDDDEALYCDLDKCKDK